MKSLVEICRGVSNATVAAETFAGHEVTVRDISWRPDGVPRCRGAEERPGCLTKPPLPKLAIRPREDRESACSWRLESSSLPLRLGLKFSCGMKHSLVGSNACEVGEGAADEIMFVQVAEPIDRIALEVHCAMD